MTHDKAQRRRIGRPPKYDFHSMKVGESKLIEGDFKTCNDCREYKAVKYFHQKGEMRFSARLKINGVRLTRIA